MIGSLQLTGFINLRLGPLSQEKYLILIFHKFPLAKGYFQGQWCVHLSVCLSVSLLVPQWSKCSASYHIWGTWFKSDAIMGPTMNETCLFASRALFQYKKHVCRYRDFHYNDKMAMRPSYIYNGDSSIGKMASLYQDCPLATTQFELSVRLGGNFMRAAHLMEMHWAATCRLGPCTPHRRVSARKT